MRSDTTVVPPREIVEKDAIWVVDPVTEVTTVRACTLERAIDKLILESLAPDQQQFLTAFVLTYRFFTTAEKFFGLVTKRYALLVVCFVVSCSRSSRGWIFAETTFF